MLTTLNTSTHNDVLVVSIAGPVSWDGMVKVGGKDVTAPVALRNLVEEQIRKGVRKFVLDVTRCTGVDSAGIGTLVVSYTKVANASGRMSLVVAEGRVLEVLKMTKLFTVFNPYDSVETAVKSMGEK